MPTRLVAAYPSLADLPAGLRQELLRGLTVMQLPAGSSLFRDSDACAGFPMVLRGRVRISRVLADGRELVLYDVGPGESCAAWLASVFALAIWVYFRLTSRLSRLVATRR